MDLPSPKPPSTPPPEGDMPTESASPAGDSEAAHEDARLELDALQAMLPTPHTPPAQKKGGGDDEPLTPES